MRSQQRTSIGLYTLLGALLAAIPAAQAETIAHWDFNSTNAVNGAFMPGNGDLADLDGDGAMDADDFRISAIDLSGNGNHLTAWTSSWMKWSRDSVIGDFSMTHNNSWPAAGTDSSFNPFLSGIDAEGITPVQWTVEAVFKSANLSSFCTILGRDGRYVGGNNSSAAALYLSTRGTDLAIEYTDVQGGKHNLQVPANLKAGVWYSVAAVSDGATLSLYLNGEVIGTLDLTTTGTNTALGQGYGTWSVARGMWADGHVDRFFGVIDEVAVSDEALDPASFVIPVPALCVDTDHDGMGDLYEEFFNLNPTNSADAAEDLDGDTLSNFEESLLGTDPRAVDTDSDELNDDQDTDPLSRAVMWWGHPDFTSGDTYSYTGPAWWLGSGKAGGEWLAEGGWQVSTNDHGTLYIDIDRSMVTNNLMLNLLHDNAADSLVYLDLADTNAAMVVVDLYGDLTTDDGVQVLSRYILPLADYPTASRIVIDADAGVEPYSVWATTLYEDSDADGLDAQQEIQFGTLDTNPDTDVDDLSDYIEAIVEGTDPLNADTDRDGFTDGEELLEIGSSPFVPMQQEGGMPGCLQVERWYGIEGNTIAALTADWRFGDTPDDVVLVEATEYTPANLDAADLYGIRIRGTITAPVSGTYTFQLTGDDAAQVWLSDTESPYGRKLLLDLKQWTDFEDLGSARSPSATVELSSNQTCYVEILLKEDVLPEHVSLWWTLPGENEPKVIASQYLHSYVQPVDDHDGDGLPDDWEEEVGFGDPNRPNGGGMRDADGDGYSDFEEYVLGLDPTVADEDGDGLSGGEEATITLTDPFSADTDDDGTNDLTTALFIPGAAYVDFGDTHIWSTWSNDGTNAMVSEAHSDPWVAYDLTITNAGMYRLAIDTSYGRSFNGIADEVRLVLEIDGIDLGELWMNHSADLPTFTCYTPWLAAGEHSIKLTVRYGRWEAVSFQIHDIELGAIDGVDADGNGIQDWMDKILAKGGDTDGDGISDADELFIHGTGVLRADSDNDGLTDSEELDLGSDPLDEDSDNDGVIDGVEVNEILTDLLNAEFDGTSVTVLTVPGAQATSAEGRWAVTGSEIFSMNRRGYVGYTLSFPEQDLYCLNINATHIWSKKSCTPMDPIQGSSFLIYVDGTYIGEYPLVTAEGVYADVRAFLPVLPAGEHTVRLFWDNVHVGLGVQIKDIQLQSLGGPDNNANGVKDWVEASIAAMAGVDAVTESYISPACIEGKARYVPFMNLVDDASSFVPVTQSAGPRWYANLPLDQDDVTEATASFQNGALEIPFTVEWVPYNLMDHNGETLYIRKGDMVKFVALPDEAVGGQFEIEYMLGMDGETVRSPNTRPLIYLFPSAGTYTVTGEYTHGNDTVTAAITVVALDGGFPVESPACLVGKQREWTFAGLPPGISYETDSSVEMEVMASPSTNNQQQTTVSLKASGANGEHMIVARAGEHGPILDSARLDTCWIQNAADGYFWTVERFEDSELWEVESIQQNLPPTVDLRIKVIVGGVTLDDYTLERWITNVDYDGTGVYKFRLFHPNDEQASVCHTFEAYQNGQFLGEVLGGGLE
ncbi:MAG: hypothetical protein JW713_05775 [Pontiellaceae bacterium]|nr:hypothetical protein [Pontiellaceae bacterium]